MNQAGEPQNLKVMYDGKEVTQEAFWYSDDASIAFVANTAPIKGQVSATGKGDVRLHEGAKVVLNLPPVPYFTGIMGVVTGKRMPYQAIPLSSVDWTAASSISTASTPLAPNLAAPIARIPEPQP